MVGQYQDVQRALQNFVPRPDRTQGHMVLIQDQDLIELISQGVLTIDPKSNPPPWLLKDAVPRRSSPVHWRGDEVVSWKNVERKSVTIEESPESVRRDKSQRVGIEVVVGGGRGPSGDSGYCTASSATPQSASMPQLSTRPDDIWEASMLYKRPVFPFLGGSSPSLPNDDFDTWSRRNRAAYERLLRRRSSAPSLGGQFRRWSEGNDDVDDEGSRPLSPDSGWEDSGQPEMLGEIMSVGWNRNGQSATDSEVDTVVPHTTG